MGSVIAHLFLPVINRSRFNNDGQVTSRTDRNRMAYHFMAQKFRVLFFHAKRSYSRSLSHSSNLITRLMVWVSFTLSTPNSVFTSIMPIPLSSIKYRVISGAVPTRESSPILLISTTSSDTRRWPRLISSRAASLLPIPLSPMISTPSP